MSFRYSIQPETETVHVIAEGPVDEASSIRAIFDVVVDPNFSPTDKIIVDLRNMEYKANTQAVFTVSDRLASLKNKLLGEIILIVPTNILYFVRLTCAAARAAGVNMNAVTEYKEEQLSKL